MSIRALHSIGDDIYACVGKDGLVRVWDMASGDVIATYTPDLDDPVTSCALSSASNVCTIWYNMFHLGE